jgi:serine/threonine protein kinase
LLQSIEDCEAGEDDKGNAMPLTDKQKDKKKKMLENFSKIFLSSTKQLSILANKELVHNDLKPPNIIYDEEKGECKFIDLDFIMKYNEKTKVLLGTRFYLAPEIRNTYEYNLESKRKQQLYDLNYPKPPPGERTEFFKLDLPYSHKSDVYSLAITMLDVAENCGLFVLPCHKSGYLNVEEMRKILEDMLEQDDKVDLPMKVFANLILQMLNDDPLKRPTAKQIGEEIALTEQTFDKFLYSKQQPEALGESEKLGLYLETKQQQQQGYFQKLFSDPERDNQKAELISTNLRKGNILTAAIVSLTHSGLKKRNGEYKFEKVDKTTAAPLMCEEFNKNPQLKAIFLAQVGSFCAKNYQNEEITTKRTTAITGLEKQKTPWTPNDISEFFNKIGISPCQDLIQESRERVRNL